MQQTDLEKYSACKKDTAMTHVLLFLSRDAVRNCRAVFFCRMRNSFVALWLPKLQPMSLQSRRRCNWKKSNVSTSDSISVTLQCADD